MENDIYATPIAETINVKQSLPDEFYVVSKRKFCILFMMTFSLYAVYWFYRNFKLYKIRHNENIWPVPRGIFSIFYAHSLFKKIDLTVKNKVPEYTWAPGLMANLYILFIIMTNVAEKLSSRDIGTPYTWLLYIITIPLTCYTLWQVQKAINVSQDNIEGTQNSHFTAANYIWCALGSIIWVGMIFGTLDALSIIDLEG